MNKKIRRIVTAVLLVIFAGSACMLGYKLLQYQEGEEIYDEAEELVNLPELPSEDEPRIPEGPDQISASPVDSGEPADTTPYVDPYADALRNMDFSALQEVNSDVLGWVLIPWTKISYPVVQTNDNDYYLHHTWKKTASAVGAIYMDYRCSADLGDFNTILYGHRMNNGSMFAGLKYYKKASYYKQHPLVYLTTAQGSFQYEIFSVYEGSPAGESYRTGLRTAEGKQAFLDAAVAASLYDTGVTPTVNDYVLTLSTCTGNGHSKRLIVHAVRRGYAASDEAAKDALEEASAEAPPETPAETPAEGPAEAPEETNPAEASEAEENSKLPPEDEPEGEAPPVQTQGEDDEGPAAS